MFAPSANDKCLQALLEAGEKMRQKILDRLRP